LASQPPLSCNLAEAVAPKLGAENSGQAKADLLHLRGSYG